MTMQEATYYLLNKLRSIYPEGEASQITDWVMEHLTGSARAERMIYKNAAITAKEEEQLHEHVSRLLNYEPVQYVLNESWFCGLRFYVDRNVLIPRPETEELVEWVNSEIQTMKPEVRTENKKLKILDIGTGSGCIAIGLKKKAPDAEVWACDVSPGALSVAKRNAEALGADINLLQVDFLDNVKQEQLPIFDMIVGNPPYVPVKDKSNMQKNVLDYEPHTALFVPDKDPLVFYKAIAEFGKTHLNPSGNIFCEIHENLGKEVSEVFITEGYTAELKKDMPEKERMIRACM